MVADPPKSDPHGADADPWAGRVAVARTSGRSFAYRPGQVLVASASWRRLDGELRREILEELGGVERENRADPRAPVVIEGVADPVVAARRLRDAGLRASVDHVFFATPGVGAAPVMFGGVSGAPVMFGGVSGAPVMFGGVGGAPVMFGGVGGAPVMFGGVGGGVACGCCPQDIGPPTGTVPAPRQSTVRPAEPPQPASGGGTCRVVVVDTGLAAERFLPVAVTAAGLGARDEPDVDDDGRLDAAAGHGTFVAAIVEQLAPGAVVEVHQVLTTFGDGSDSDVASILWSLVDDPPEVVNLSFAGYSEDDGPPLAVRQAVEALIGHGCAVVAAAGNDATCRPSWPAALDGVVGVAALGPDGPAWFTNHGGWVRACAPGVDVVSRFFTTPTSPSDDEKTDVEALAGIVEWASWSGTSFAAPIVAGVIARTILRGYSPRDAVANVVDDPSRLHLRGLGTVINERPW